MRLVLALVDFSGDLVACLTFSGRHTIVVLLVAVTANDIDMMGSMRLALLLMAKSKSSLLLLRDVPVETILLIHMSAIEALLFLCLLMWFCLTQHNLGISLRHWERSVAAQSGLV